MQTCSDVFAVMGKYVEAGICCAVRFSLGHQLPRSVLRPSMEHLLSVNSLMGGKPNSAGGRGKGICTNHAETNGCWPRVLQIGPRVSLIMDPVAAWADVSSCHNSALGWQRNDAGFSCGQAGVAAAGPQQKVTEQAFGAWNTGCPITFCCPWNGSNGAHERVIKACNPKRFMSVHTRGR